MLRINPSVLVMGQQVEFRVKKRLKVLKENIIKQHSTGKITEISAGKTLNIPFSTIGLIIGRCKVHGTTSNRPQTAEPHRISQYGSDL